jgi:hypothetical protein
MEEKMFRKDEKKLKLRRSDIQHLNLLDVTVQNGIRAGLDNNIPGSEYTEPPVYCLPA